MVPEVEAARSKFRESQIVGGTKVGFIQITRLIRPIRSTASRLLCLMRADTCHGVTWRNQVRNSCPNKENLLLAE